MNFCSSKVLSDSDVPSNTHSLKHATKIFIPKNIYIVTDFADTAYNVGSFLRRTKLVSSFIKEIYKKNCFVIFVWIR